MTETNFIESIHKAITEYEDSRHKDFKEINLESIVFRRRENIENHGTSEFISDVYRYVKNGEVISLKPLVLSLIGSHNIGKMSNDPLKQAMYSFVSLVTIVSRAAIEGGINRECALSISDAFIQKADKIHNEEEIARLLVQMVYAYTHLVASKKGKKYSDTTMRALDYIDSHLHYKINITEMAESCRISKSHLSVKFKNDTGTTVTDYIENARLKEAADLLKFSSMTIQTISICVGFVTPSYFITRFKKKYGITPSEYRSRNSRTQWSFKEE